MLLGGATAWFLLSSDRDLEDVNGLVIASVPFGMTIATGALIFARWLSDRLKEGAYGELVRVIDPDERNAQLPHLVVAASGFVTSALGLFLLLTRDEFSRTWTASLYSALVSFSTYDILGMASLASMYSSHAKRAARLQGIREQAERDERDRRRSPGSNS